MCFMRGLAGYVGNMHVNIILSAKAPQLTCSDSVFAFAPGPCFAALKAGGRVC